MSLLIKALANAEKDKQAERNKKQQSDAFSLELAPKDEAAQQHAIDEVNRLTAQKAEEFLSLEEEAGLGIIPAVAVKKAELFIDKSLPEKVLASTSGQGDTPPLPQKKVEDRAVERAAYQSQLEISALETNQKTAAKVFVANQSAKPPSSMAALLLLGVGGALLIMLGIKGYQYLTKPASVIVQPLAPISVPSTTEQNTVAAESQNTPAIKQADTLPVAEVNAEGAVENADHTSAKQAVSNVKANDEAFAVKPNKPQLISRVEKNIEAVATSEESPEAPRKAMRNTEKQTSLKLSSKASASAVDPTLLAAYQAFNRGEDASAQQQYREVLKRDVRNVDALLGMAAIAQRQGRDADAAGWYQKVLDVEPQNSLAQSALASPQSNVDATSAESRVKNMLAQQPEAAHLHAALGNIYAEQNQWASAQGAYFDASRFEPKNADYAFNVAVSLEHMGKKNLALLQYQRALALLNELGGTSPDRATLEARIQALQ
jgi:Tfp pilus assembly protein PilF